jgi:Ca2+-binding RTX toxin-like protein
MPAPVLWGSEFRINPPSAGYQEDAQLIALKDGSFAAVWYSNVAGQLALHGQVYDTVGTPMSGVFVVNTTPIALNLGSSASLTVLEDGRFVVVWSSYGADFTQNERDIRARIFNSDGTVFDRGGAEGIQDFFVNTTRVGQQTDPSVTALKNGGFVVAYGDPRESGQLLGQTFNSTGQRVGPTEFKISADSTGHQPFSAMTTLSNGTYVAVYRNEGGSLDGRLFTAEGQPAPETGEFSVTTTSSGAPKVTALGGGRFVVMWVFGEGAGGDGSRSSIKAQIFEADGTRVNGEFIVNLITEGDQTLPSVVALPDGGFAVAFNHDGIEQNSPSVIYLTTFNRDGARTGDEIRVDPPTVEGHPTPSLTVLTDGRIVVAWSEQDRDPEADSYGQIVDPRFSAIMLNGTSLNDHYIGTGFGDVLGGAAGSDRLRGEGGNDTLDGGAGADVLDGGAGFDFASFASATSGVTASLTGGAGDSFSGIEGIIGSAYGDTLIGNGTADLRGGLGADTYQVQAGDLVTENASGGIDMVIASASYSLSASVEVEVLKLASLSARTAANLTGSSTANEITGHAGANLLKGEGGHDVLKASSGNDRVYGGTGNDKLYGGSGNDKLYGGTGSGRDIFVFDTRPNKSTNVDRVYDFNPRYDTFHLDNAAFTKLGTGSAARPKKFKSDMFVKSDKAQDGQDRIVYDKKTGALYYDKDGTGGAAQVKIATLSKNLALSHNDFFVI